MTVIRTATTEDMRIAADRLALRVADLVRERDIAVGEAQDAQQIALRFKAERDQARAEAAVSTRVNAALKTRLHDAGVEIRGLNEQVVELTTKRDLAMRTAEIACSAQWAAERELHERDTRRWRRKRRH